MDYKEEFTLAIERTKRLKLEVPEISFKNDRFLTQEKLKELPFIILKEIGELSPEEIAAQCFSIHYRLLKPLSIFFNAEIFFTIGYVFIPPNQYLFKFTEDYLKDLLSKKVINTELKMHAWLTLPSMEILDFALGTTIAQIQGLKELYGAVIAKHPDELLHGMKYHPMLVGYDFLKKIGGIIEFEVLVI